MFLDHTQRRSTIGRTPLDELITRPEESYRLCCVVVCDLETSKMDALYMYDISRLKVKVSALVGFIVLFVSVNPASSDLVHLQDVYNCNKISSYFKCCWIKNCIINAWKFYCAQCFLKVLVRLVSWQLGYSSNNLWLSEYWGKQSEKPEQRSRNVWKGTGK